MRDRNLSGNLEENSLGIRRRQRHLDDGVGKSVASPSRGGMLFEFGLGELAQIARPVPIADSTRTLKSIGRGMSWPSDTLHSLVSS